MPFLLPALPAIIGAAGSIGGSLLGSGHSKSSGLEQELAKLAQGDAAKRDSIVNSTSGPLSYFYGSDPTKSGLYKDFVTTGTESTAQAYDNAKANIAQKANTAGFGYAQPITQGANAEINNEEAKAQADVPRKALLDTVGPELSALNTRAGEAHDYNPASYAGPAVGAAGTSDQQQSGLFSSLFDTATKAFGQVYKPKGTGGSQDSTYFPSSGN